MKTVTCDGCKAKIDEQGFVGTLSTPRSDTDLCGRCWGILARLVDAGALSDEKFLALYGPPRT